VVVNLTLVAFFLSYCGFLLVYGPLSDRWGRRRPLLAGIGLFIAACLVCGLSASVGMMIAGRVLQGAGAAAASAIVLAISKDLYAGHERQKIFIRIGVIVAAAPMIAPVIGGWVITLLSWRWIFLLQACMGLIAFVGVWRMAETLPGKHPPRWREVATSYLRLLANFRFTALLLTLSLTGIPIFAFIGGSSDLYITRLGYDERQFGYFFGLNSLAFVLAPLTFSRLVKKHSTVRMLPYGFAGMLLASLLLLSQWLAPPWGLTLPMWLLTFSFSFCRPPGNNLVLEQVDRDTGAASSLLVFVFFTIGAISMWFYSLDWSDKTMVLGLMGLLPVSCTLLSWALIKGRLRAES
jgi:DHA1 family bicyclomycin/chloramphenicol resistance-like MFS transporter